MILRKSPSALDHVSEKTAACVEHDSENDISIRASYSHEEPSAGKPLARIRGGESRMAELPDQSPTNARKDLHEQLIVTIQRSDILLISIFERNAKDSGTMEAREHELEVGNLM
jgi:hypothetical protein